MKRNGFTVMAKLIGLVKPLAGYMVMAITMGVLGQLCATFITVFGGFGILDVLGLESPLSVKAIFVYVIVFALVRGLLRYIEQGSNHYIAFRLLALIRDKVFQALRRLSPARLEGRDKGELINIITTDTELLEVFYAHTISPTCIWVVYTIILTVFIGQYSSALALIALCAYLCIGIGEPLLANKISGDDGLKFRNSSGDLSGFVLDSLRGVDETQQYADGDSRLEKMNAQSDNLADTENRLKKKTGLNGAMTTILIYFFDLLMLFTSVSLYRKGTVGFEGVLVPTIAMMSSFGPSISLANLGSTLQQTFAAGNRILDILEGVPAVEEVSGNEDIAFTGASTKDVTFAYEDEEILKDFSLDIEENKITGIIGKSGSGKSTLLKLLMRFWDVSKGEIDISGKNIKEVNTSNLRKMESFVTQETHLFCDSIKNNVRIAKLDATDEEIVEACKKASIHDFIMTLPNGYDTNVGELGDTLSGGERQRIGLARAFLHDAPLMLLDEPTSNLDSLNEGIILKSLAEERSGKTIVLVSHRESTMRIADRTITVENGRMS